MGGQAGAASESEAGAPACDYPRGECDGTLQTVCESDLDWNARNCGACGRACDGACSQGRCSLEEPVFDGGEAVAVLADGRDYYFLTFGSQLIHVDAWGGYPEILTDKLDAPDPLDSLARTEDSIYVWGGIFPSPQRVSLTTGEVVQEALETRSFGASRAGAYYVQGSDLWFRPTIASEAKRLATQVESILCSSASFVLVETEWPDSSLFFVRGAELTRIGSAPDYIQRALCSTNAALLLNDEQAIRVSEDGVEPAVPITQRHFLADRSLPAFDGWSFSLSYENRGHANVRTFELGPIDGGGGAGGGGAADDDASIVGLPNEARLVHRDTAYVWYNAPDPPRLTPQLKRARLR